MVEKTVRFSYSPLYHRVILPLFWTTTAILFLLFVHYVFDRSAKEVREIKQRAAQKEYSIAVEKPSMVGWSVTGERVWDINAKEIIIASNQTDVTFKEAKATFYTKDKADLIMTADSIDTNIDTKNLYIYGNLKVKTSDGMKVISDRIEWFHFVQAFIFPNGVKLVTKEGNELGADYVQSDRNFDLLEMVGNAYANVKKIDDPTFLRENKITQEEIKTQDLRNIRINADMVRFDRIQQVIEGQSLRSPKPFTVISPKTGTEIKAEVKGKPKPVSFKKSNIVIYTDQLIANVKMKWARNLGNVRLEIYPSKPKKKESKLVKSIRKERATIYSSNIEYWWTDDRSKQFFVDRPSAVTLAKSRLVQKDREASADSIAFYAKDRMIHLVGNVRVKQKSGKWIEKSELVKKFKSEKTKKEFYKPTTIMARDVWTSVDKRDLFAQGNAKVIQKDKEARADTVQYIDSEKKMVAEGTVKVNTKKGENFTGDQVIFFTDRDDVEVNGQVLAEIKIPLKYRKDIDQARKKKPAEEKPKAPPDEKRTVSDEK